MLGNGPVGVKLLVYRAMLCVTRKSSMKAYSGQPEPELPRFKCAETTAAGRDPEPIDEPLTYRVSVPLFLTAAMWYQVLTVGVQVPEIVDPPTMPNCNCVELICIKTELAVDVPRPIGAPTRMPIVLLTVVKRNHPSIVKLALPKAITAVLGHQR